jgi:hypothetical protein
LFCGVAKTRKNEFTASKYANLEDVTTAAMPVLAEVGLSVCYIPTVANDRQLLETVLYDDEAELRATVDIGALMPKAEAIRFGSALTYARRYSLCCMLNILTYDDDGSMNAHAETRPATTEQKAMIYGLIKSTGTNEEKVAGFILERGWGASVEDLGFRAAAIVIGMLKKKGGGDGTKK